MKNAVFWDMMTHRYDNGDTVVRGCLPRPLSDTTSLQTKRTQSLTLKIEAICSSETSYLRRTAGRHLPEDRVLRDPTE
jgi:hypothetical protein